MGNKFKVKGTGLSSTDKYVANKFPEDYNKWINELPTESKRLYTGIINATDWYNVEDAYYHPVKKVSELFFDGDDKKAAFDIGAFSAEYALKGVYKVYLMIARPQSLMKASKRIISKYYTPVTVEIDDIEKKSLVLSTTKIHETEILDYRTIGWCVKALELANCKNVQYEKIDARYPEMFSVKLLWD